MKKQRAQSAPPPRKVQNNATMNIVLTGAICLAAGLAAGYYLGRATAPAGIVAAPVGAPQQGGIVNPAAFLEMESTLKAAAGRNPADLSTLIQLGNLYYDNGRFREAVDWYGRALEIDPGNVNVRTDRGTSYWNIGQPDAAIAEFTRSLEKNPTHAQTLYNLGVVYLHGKSNPAEARKAWERLLATNPGYPDRDKLKQQLAELPGGSPEAGATKGVEDLLQRMNK